MKTANIYLNFNGNTEEAFKFYKSIFGGEFLTVQRFKDVPQSEKEKSNFSKSDENRILHIALKVGNSTLMGSDFPKSMSKDFKMGNNFSVSLVAGSREEVDKVFGKLAKGGKVDMPLGDMFWGDYFGGLTDRFGVKWMISFSKNPPYQNQPSVQKSGMKEGMMEMERTRMDNELVVMMNGNKMPMMSKVEEEREFTRGMGNGSRRIERRIDKMEMENENGIRVSRVFDAPIEKVWKAWTNEKEIKKWWGPKDFTAPIVKTDFKVSGNFLYCMRGAVVPNGPVSDYCNTGEFLQINPMRKIVSKVSFSDKKGNPVRASYYEMPGEWPMHATHTISFEELENGNRTRVMVEATGVPLEMRENAQLGWEQQFDKFENVLMISKRM